MQLTLTDRPCIELYGEGWYGGNFCNIHSEQMLWRSRDVQCIDGFLKIHDLDLGNCRGQSYENVSVMSGKYNGLQAKVREKNILAS